jgi:hypothetical protein
LVSEVCTLVGRVQPRVESNGHATQVPMQPRLCRAMQE